MISFAKTSKDLMKPPFIANHKSIMRDTGVQVAFELLTPKYKYGAVAVTITTAAVANDTALAASGGTKKALKKGDTIYLGTGKSAVVSADTAAGATSIPVEALPFTVALNTVGYHGAEGGGFVPAGTECDELSDGRVLPSDIGTGGVTCAGILETSADEDSSTDAASGYGFIRQGMIYENLLPNATGSPKVINSTHKTELLARGGAWVFMQYSDTTA